MSVKRALTLPGRFILYLEHVSENYLLHGDLIAPDEAQ